MATAEYTTAEFAGKTVVSLRHFGPYETADETWADLSAFAVDHDLTGPGIQAIGIVYDDPTVTPPDEIRYDAALTIDPKNKSALMSRVEEIGDVVLRGSAATLCNRKRPLSLLELAASPALKWVHKGPYSELIEVYTDAKRAASSLGEDPLPPPPYYEVYVNNPRFTKDENLVTEVYIPFPNGKAAGA